MGRERLVRTEVRHTLNRSISLALRESKACSFAKRGLQAGYSAIEAFGGEDESPARGARRSKRVERTN